MLLATSHSYEELRAILVDILLRRESIKYGPHQYSHLVNGVAEVLARRGSTGVPGHPSTDYLLDSRDAELVRDIFWDLFRQGFITLGSSDNSPMWPHLRLSYFGERTLAVQSPFRFHDTGSFMTLVRKEVPDISPVATAYLEEAVASFFAGCLLACCVMVGGGAEAEFVRLVKAAASNTIHGAAFAQAEKERFIFKKINRFRRSLEPFLKSLPQDVTEDLDTRLFAIQSVLRVARNEAGHPAAGKVPSREDVYVSLQLFIPFARQLGRLRSALS